MADDGSGIPDASKEAMVEASVRGEAVRTMDDRVLHGLIARITLPSARLAPATA